MKKGWFIALGLLLIGGIGAYVWYNRLRNEAAAGGGPYDDTLKPRLELSRFDFRDISEETITMNMYLLVDNPLPVAFKARKVDYSFAINGEEVVKDAYNKTIELESRDSTTLALPAKLQAGKLTRVLKDLEARGQDSTTYTIRATFDLDVPILGERTFTQTIERKLPTYYIPQIKVDDIDLGKLGLKRTDVAAKVNVINKNKFPYNITDTRYTIRIDGKEIAEGVQNDPILIRAQATTPVVFPVTVRPDQLLGLAPKALFDKENTPYSITFQCRILDKNDNPVFQQSQFVTTVTGTLADFKELADKAKDKKEAQRDAEKQERKEERQERREERKAERQQARTNS